MKRSILRLSSVLVGTVIFLAACVSPSQQRERAGGPVGSPPAASPRAPSGAPPAAPRAAPAQDCVSFDPATATVSRVQGRWKIVDGSHWLFDFGSKKTEADRALAIIKKYNVNQSCFVGRPKPSFEYLLVSGKSPAGSAPGEDCVSFSPATTTMAQDQGRWKIVDGTHWLFDFGNRLPEAEQALTIIQHHGFTRSCFVGRPNPSFKYMRK